MHGSLPSDSPPLDSRPCSAARTLPEFGFPIASIHSSFRFLQHPNFDVSGIRVAPSSASFFQPANDAKMPSSHPREPFRVCDVKGGMRLIQKRSIGCLSGPPLSFTCSRSRLSRPAMSVHKVVVASKNPVKINAAASAFAKTFPSVAFSVQGIEVDSGVSNQPMTNEETFQGAKNRAKNAVGKSEDAEFVVAIEGGVEWCHLSSPPNLFCFAWAVVLSKDAEGVAKTAAFMLPPPIAELISGGLELGEADDRLFSRNNSKRRNGTVGILTDNLITRENYYEHAICLALIPFVHPQLYRSPSMPEIGSSSSASLLHP